MHYIAYIRICDYAKLQKGQTELRQNLNLEITRSIDGARGLTGSKLTKVLLKNPQAWLKFCFATSVFRLTDYHNSVDADQVSYRFNSQKLENFTDVAVENFNRIYDFPLEIGIIEMEALI